MDQSTNSTDSYHVIQTTQQLLSLQAFHGIVWAGFALCFIAYCTRVYIRYVCFRRLLADDYCMLVALILLCAAAATGQMVLEYIYNLMAVGNGEYTPGPNFIDETKKGLLGFSVQSLFCYCGLWLIKFSFLLFFYRLGHRVTKYLVFWWIVLVVVVGCFAIEIGTLQFNCLFGSIDEIMTTCNLSSSMESTFRLYILSCIIDVISDILIICFPVVILWRVRINLRRKLILSGIFSLVAFTIAVTIVRGSIFGGVYKAFDPNDVKAMNITWIWFWFNIEFIVSFIVACLVSFRALFAQENPKPQPAVARQRTKDGAYDPKTAGFRARARRLQDSILDTFRTLEGTNPEMSLLPHPPSGRLSVDFSQGDHWGEPIKPVDVLLLSKT
ncbi:hypothetical protein F4809DRAFT_596992 [Biscogniauxia mediterranea]|nr:hypothetical protein F4809DRAFT_596992 [Biscogniauxia mediterranea]